MAGKPRVHELAKELGVTSKELMGRLKEQGEFVKSASSTIEAPVARRLRESFGGSKPSPAASAASVSESSAPRPAGPRPDADQEHHHLGAGREQRSDVHPGRHHSGAGREQRSDAEPE